ncbi:hypothetical protein CLU79DRAFT_718494 [Phycomyces nitens]|nr:hypothetical protein CLU79DRAFT_718494 [Phycomyces nitens]
MIEEGSVIAFGDSLFHLDCFICAKCQTTVDYNSNLLLLTDGRPVCENCAYNCTACKETIRDEAVMTGEEAYHADCFKCINCRKKINDLVYTQTSKRRAEKLRRREEREKQKSQTRQFSQDTQYQSFHTTTQRQPRFGGLSPSNLPNRHASRVFDPQTVADSMQTQQRMRVPLEARMRNDQDHRVRQDSLLTPERSPPTPARSRSSSVDIITKTRLNNLLGPNHLPHNTAPTPTPSRSDVISGTKTHPPPSKSLLPISNTRQRFSSMPAPLQISPMEKSKSVPDTIYRMYAESTTEVQLMPASPLEFSLPEISSLNLSFFDDDSSDLLNLTKTLGASLSFSNESSDPGFKPTFDSRSSVNINKASELLRTSLNLSTYDKVPTSPLPRISSEESDESVSTDRAYVLKLQSDLKSTNSRLTVMETNFNRIKDASKSALEEFTRAKEEFAKETALRQQYESTASQLQQQLVIIQQAQSLNRNQFVGVVKEDIERIVRVRIELDKSCNELKECRTTLSNDIEELLLKSQAPTPMSSEKATMYLNEQQKALLAEIRSLNHERDSLKTETRTLSKARDEVIHEMVMLNTKNAELSTMNNDLSRRMTEREREAAAIMAGTSFLNSPSPSRSTELHSPVPMQRKYSDTTVERKVAARDSFNGTQAPKMFKIKKKNGGTIFGKRGGKNNKTDPAVTIYGEARSGINNISNPNGRTVVKPQASQQTLQNTLLQNTQQDGHAFQPTSFLRPTKCDACGEKMWGLSELRCQCCGYITHAKCLSHVPQLCHASTTSTLDLFGASELDLRQPVSMFGNSLIAQVEQEERSIPILVETCITAVEARGMDYEGIYRKSGGAAQIRAIQLAFDQGKPVNLSDDDEFNDICAITSVLKHYFRELPDPLLTYELYPKFIDAVSMNFGLAKIDKFFELLSQLPTANYETLKILCQHLYRVQERNSENLMTTKNLAMVFGPTLMQDRDASRDLLDMNYKNATIEFIINQASEVFS